MKNNQFFTGIFLDDRDLINGIKKIQDEGISIFDVRTPFPVHGLDDILKFQRSRLPKLGFVAGALGAILAFLFQAWVFTTGWPLNFGGKPLLSVPSFIPVTFEMAVLFASISLVFGFLIKSGLGPGAETVIFDDRSTDDVFLVIIQENEYNHEDKVMNVLSDIGAQDVKRVNISS